MFTERKTYKDRKGFEYVCLEVGLFSVTFTASKADGKVYVAGRNIDGRYCIGEDHDYDILPGTDLSKEKENE